MNPYDKNAIKALKDWTEYELWVINFFRSKFHGQMDDSSSSTTFIEGNRTESGKLKATRDLKATNSGCEETVRKSLQNFIPLAFGSSFKLQDMIIEWILKNNNINKWRFVDKIKEYPKLLKNPSASFPSYFSKEPRLNEAFFSLFKVFVDYRNVLTHGSSFLIRSDGSLEMTNRAGNTLLLKPNDQAVYHQLCCLVLEVILNPNRDLLFNFELVKSDFAKLEPFHKIKGFVKSNVRREKVRYIIPIEYKKSEMPYACNINMDELWERVRETWPVGRGEQPIIILSLDVEGHTKETVYSWDIPPSHVPLRGALQLTEGDPEYDRFLIRVEAQ